MADQKQDVYQDSKVYLIIEGFRNQFWGEAGCAVNVFLNVMTR